MGLQTDWKQAKANFEKTTKQKKPDTGFFSHATGIDGAFGVLDGVLAKKDFTGARSALDTLEKKSGAYSIILIKEASSPTAKAGNYVDEVKKLNVALGTIVKQARIEVRKLDAVATAKAEAEAKAAAAEAAAAGKVKQEQADAKAREKEKQELLARGKAFLEIFQELASKADAVIGEWNKFSQSHVAAVKALRAAMKKLLLGGDADDGKALLAERDAMEKAFNTINERVDAFVQEAGKRQPRSIAPDIIQLMPQLAKWSDVHMEHAKAVMEIVNKHRKPVSAELSELQSTLTESFKERISNQKESADSSSPNAKRIKKHTSSIIGNLQYLKQSYSTVVLRADELAGSLEEEAGIKADIDFHKNPAPLLKDVYTKAMQLKGATPGKQEEICIELTMPTVKALQAFSPAQGKRIEETINNLMKGLSPNDTTGPKKKLDVYLATLSTLRETLVELLEDVYDARGMAKGNRLKF